MTEIKIEKEAYKTTHKGYVFTAIYLLEPKGQALIKIEKDGVSVKEFLFPAYKIYNIAAHADDIIMGLEQSSDIGLRIAGSDGLGGNSYAGESIKG